MVPQVDRADLEDLERRQQAHAMDDALHRRKEASTYHAGDAHRLRVLTPAQITANTNDYNPPGFAGIELLRLNTDAARNLTGIASRNYPDGWILALHYVGSSSIVLKDADANSAAENRFALTGDITMIADDLYFIQFDRTSLRWRAASGSVVRTATRTTLLSGTFAIDSTGIKTVTTAHGLSATPALKDVQLTVVEDSNVDDWAFNLLKTESTDGTNVVAKINVSTASATGGATAKLAIMIVIV